MNNPQPAPAHNNPQDKLARIIRARVEKLSEQEMLCLICRIISSWQFDHESFTTHSPSGKALTAVLVAVHKDLAYNPEGGE